MKLHPLLGITKEQDEDWKGKFGYSIKNAFVVHLPAIVEFDGRGGSKIIRLFDESREPIELTEWLEQDLFNPKIKIGELIKSVADKLGKHSDPDYNDTLNYTRSIKVANEDIHIGYIIGIGEYVLKLIKMAM